MIPADVIALSVLEGLLDLDDAARLLEVNQ